MRTALPRRHLSQLFASLLALSLLATLPATMGEAEAVTEPTEGCSIVHPLADYVYEQGERQIFTVNCMTPDQQYHAELAIKNAVSGLSERELPTVPSVSGFDSSAVLLPVDDQTVGELDPGLYDLVASFPDGTIQTVRFGIASLIDSISSTCADGFAVFDGSMLAFEDRDGPQPGVYYRIRTHSPNADTAWVCLTGSPWTTGTLTPFSGRLAAVFDNLEAPVDIVTTAGPCLGSDDGVVPRPLWSGSSGDPSDPLRYTTWFADLRRAEGKLTVCAEITNAALGDFEASIVIDVPNGAELQSLVFVPDVPGQTQRTASPPRPTALPSSTCYHTPLSVQQWGSYIDAQILGNLTRIDHLSAYAWAPVPGASTGYNLCWRIEGPSTSGGRLEVTGWNDLSSISWSTAPPPPNTSGSPCTLTEFETTVAGATFGVHYHGPSSSDGASVCLRAATIGVDLSVLAGDDEDVRLHFDP